MECTCTPYQLEQVGCDCGAQDEPKKARAFIERGSELAAFFTQPEPAKTKYLASGMKPIEEFCTDILNNLVSWAAEGEAVFYRTREHWYMFQRETEGELEGVIWMTRYRNGSWARMDSWANPSSLSGVGARFLAGHLEKRLPVFP